MAFNTNNPLGSTDPRDLSDNAENLDRFANGTDPAYNDRLSKSRKSLAGMESDFASDQASRATTFANFLASSGYEFLGEYAGGIEVTEYNQIIRESGEFWRPAASTSLPYTTTGAGMPESGAFVAVGDAALRQEIGSGIFRADSLANLESTNGRFDGDAARLVSGTGRDGDFRWDSSDLSSTLVLASSTSDSVDDTTDTINDADHPFSDGDGVITQATVNGLTAHTVYWVVNSTSGSYQLSATFGGGAIDLTGTTNFTVDHLLDPLQGVYVTPSSDRTGASGAWVRDKSDYLSAEIFGGDAAGGDCFSNLQLMIDHVRHGGTVSTSGWTGEKIIDSRFEITKPCTVKSHDDVSFKLADQSSLFHSTANGSRSLIYVTSSFVTVEGFIIDSNKLQNYVTVDGTNYYFLESPTDVGGTSSDFRYLRCITVDASPSDTCSYVTIRGNRLTNCSVHAIGISGQYDLTYFTSNGPIVPSQYSEMTTNVTVQGNYISGGCRSGVYFINGVVNSVMESNVCENWAWAGFRFYYGTDNCLMENNKTFLDKTISFSDFESSDGYLGGGTFAGFVGVGYRVGHPDRAPGTSTNSRIIGNYHYSYGAGRPRTRPLGAIVVEINSNNCTIQGNIVDGEGDNTISSQFTGAVIDLNSPMNMRVIDNIVRSVEFNLMLVTGGGSGLTMHGNHFEFTAAAPATSFFPRAVEAIGGVSGLEIKNNYFKNYNVVAEITASGGFILSTNEMVLNDFVFINTQLVQLFGGNHHILNNSVYVYGGDPTDLKILATSQATDFGIFDNNRIFKKSADTITSPYDINASSNVINTGNNFVYDSIG